MTAFSSYQTISGNLLYLQVCTNRTQFGESVCAWSEGLWSGPGSGSLGWETAMRLLSECGMSQELISLTGDYLPTKNP